MSKKIKVIVPTILLSSVIVVPGTTYAIVSHFKNVSKPIPTPTPTPEPTPQELQKEIFDVSDGTINGLKENYDPAKLERYCGPTHTLKLPAAKTIGKNAFANFSSPFVETITIGESTTTIDDYAFFGCTAQNITWEGTSTLTKIGEAAFCECNSLQSFKFPTSLLASTEEKPIGDCAFYRCTALAEIDLSELTAGTIYKLPEAKHAFRGVASGGNFVFPTEGFSVIEKSYIKSFFSGSYLGFAPWKIDNEEDPYIMLPQKYMNYSDEGKTFTGVTAFLNVFDTVYLPSNVTAIDSACSTFKDYPKAIKHIILSDSGVTQLPDAMCARETILEGDVLESVALNSKITSIPKQAFKNCVNLITFENATTVTTIGEEAFENDKFLSLDISSLTGLTTIGKFAFDGCATLQATSQIVVKANMSIGEAAFYEAGCDDENPITSVKLQVTGKDAVIIGEYAFANISKLNTIDISSFGSKVGEEIPTALADCQNIFMDSGKEAEGTKTIIYPHGIDPDTTEGQESLATLYVWMESQLTEQEIEDWTWERAGE